MNRVVDFFKKNRFLLFSLFLALILLLITSKCSPLYPLNDWVDTNAFFTMGKSMMNGVVPYKDLFEQKGILLYLIYGIGYLLSNTTFHGVFIIEVLFFTVYLYYIKKIISLFLDEKYSYIILPIIGLLTTTAMSFTHGGAAEEFCLPFFMITLYYFLKHFKEGEISNKELFLAGALSGMVFLIKYTLLGFWFGFMAFIFFDLFRKRKIKRAFTSCIWFLLGMFTPLLISLVYFLRTDSLKDFINCYFTINMTAYNDMSISILSRLVTIFSGTVGEIWNHGIIVFLSIILMPLYLIPLKIDRYAKWSIVGIFLITSLGLFWGMHFYRYYSLPLLIFMIFSFIAIFIILDKYALQLFNLKYKKPIYVLYFICILFLTYHNANYKEMLLMDKDDMFQYKYAKYINEFDNPTLLNMGYLDGGLYTTTGIVPNTRFFEVQNIPYSKFKDNLDDMKKNVQEGNVMFILYYTRDSLEEVREKDGYIFDNYDLKFDDQYLFEKKTYNAFLFQKIE